MLEGMEKPAAPNGSVESPENGESDPKISLVRGGPFYRAQEAVRLIDDHRWNLGKRIIVAVVVAWVPVKSLVA